MNLLWHKPYHPRTRSKHQSAKPPPTGPRCLYIASVGLVMLAAGVGLWLQLAGSDTPGAPASPVADSLPPRPAETALLNRSTAPSAPLPAPLPPDLPESGAPTARPSFEQWLARVRRVAEGRGISPRTPDAALTDLRPIDGVLKQDARQSEYQKTFFEYLQGTVSGARIQRGRALLQRHHALLDTMERKYGVSAPVLIALWGMESDFGAVTGSTPVIATLASLAYDGRRRERFLDELLAALAIIDEGRASPAQMRGSWAGAMGQPQFLPSTYLQHGRDGDGDGRVDIWTSEADTLASAASYLFNLGWRRGEPWIREARLPAGFDHYQARLDVRRSLSDWGRLGVVGGDGQALPDSETKASILLPAGHLGPAILVFENFRVITDWNRSLHYALAVGHLANRIAGAGPLRAGPPPGDKALPRGTIEAMQRQLTALGFDAGEPDGMVGRQTRAAVRDYQRATGRIADAYPNAELARAIARDAGVEPAPAPGRVVADIQRYLNALGHDAGTVDGIFGNRTSTAIRAYQRSAGLPETGQPSTNLLRQLAADVGG
jgi:membrane-bound lytic murein transglycosylase B